MIYLLGFNYKLFSELKYTTILQVAAGKQKLKPVFEQVDQIVQFSTTCTFWLKSGCDCSGLVGQPKASFEKKGL